jgi:hypothetical protein
MKVGRKGICIVFVFWAKLELLQIWTKGVRQIRKVERGYRLGTSASHFRCKDLVQNDGCSHVVYDERSIVCSGTVQRESGRENVRNPPWGSGTYILEACKFGIPICK